MDPEAELNMNGHVNHYGKIIYKVALTGGPCGGKTTAQVRISDFFENLGWKVFRIPEAANLLLSGGVRFSELDDKGVLLFQENLLKTMLQLEQTYFELANRSEKNTLIICDRGAMDPSAYCSSEIWSKILHKNHLNHQELRDNRYNQVIHLVTAADGAENGYTCNNSSSRSEGLEMAIELDRKVVQAWIGHPYVDVIDNQTGFEQKVNRLISTLACKMGVEVGDRLAATAKKRKWLVTKKDNDTAFGKFQDFDVVHDYLITSDSNYQVRLRKRGQKGFYTYMHTLRRSCNDGWVEQKRQLTSREYGSMLLNRDPRRHKLRKTRRCFIWENQYFQLDTYNKPCPKVCENLMILETYTTNTDKKMPLPPFLTIEKEITGNKQYSMFQLSVKEESGESQETNVQVIPRCQSTSMPKSVNSFASLNGIQAESGRKRSPSDSSGISSSPRGYSCLEDNDMPLP